MEKTIFGCCGKDCSECPYRVAYACTLCPQFTDGPCDCAIAQCCRTSGLTSCDQCEKQADCRLLTETDAMPRERLRRRNAEQVQNIQRDKTMIPRSVLLLIVSAALALLLPVGFILLRSASPTAVRTLSLFGLFVGIAPGIVLLTAGSVRKRFPVAGCWRLGAVAFLAAAAALDVPILRTAALVAALLCGSMSAYHEMNGFAELTKPYDAALAEGWRRLWPMWLAVLICTYVAAGLLVLLVRYIPGLSVLGFLAMGLLAIFVIAAVVCSLIQHIKTILCLKKLRAPQPPAETEAQRL